MIDLAEHLIQSLKESWGKKMESSCHELVYPMNVAFVGIYSTARWGPNWQLWTWGLDIVFQGVIFAQLERFPIHVHYNAFPRREQWTLLIFVNFLKTTVTCQGFRCNLIRPSISKFRSYKLIFLWSLDTVEWFLV